MLYLFRHGATTQHILRTPGDLTPATHDEWMLDHALSERGRAEAVALGDRLKGLPTPDRILVGPRRRTRETAENAGIPLDRAQIEDRLVEWHGAETEAELHARARWLLGVAEDGVTWAFTHGGFIRAVVAALQVGEDPARFGPHFHDLRRALAVWTASMTVVGHGAAGLELVAVNVCPDVDQLCGR